MSKPILSARQICKVFSYPARVEVLKGISLDLYPGESIAIMGASGEGKSTLLHILGTLEEPTSGQLIIVGQEATRKPAAALRNQHIGFIFQGFNLLEDYSVLQNILMPALIGRKDIAQGSAAYKRGCQLVDQVGLSHRLHYPIKLLSGGEKQRVALARAFLNNPEMILADEPSGNLDHETSLAIHTLLLDSVKKLNKGMIVVTHDQELANLCDRTVYLCDGYLKEKLSNGLPHDSKS